MVSDNIYSELCNDPNMMPNLSGAGSLSPKMTTEEYYIVPKDRGNYIEHRSGDKRDQLCHHHPQDGRTSPSSSHNDNGAGKSVEIDHPTPTDVFSDNQSDVKSQTGFRMNSESDLHPEDGEAGPEQGSNKPKTNTHQPPGVTASKKPERQEDIVERNKITLGRNTFAGGSYMMAYAHKHGMAHSGSKVRRPNLIFHVHCSDLYVFILDSS